MEAKNVDDILVKSMQNQQAPVQPAQPPVPEVSAPQPKPEPEHAPEQATTPRPSGPQDQGVHAQENKEVLRETSVEQKESTPAPEPTESKQPSNIDEYGNPIEKPRVYTEEEVQRMIRERLSRGRHAEQPQPTQQQVQKAADDFKADPNSEESYEVQLNRFIDRRIETREREHRDREWKQQEAQKQADFEAKFNTGMTKYQDFEQVVGKVGPSITPSMMLATRSLDNPAAFLYAAAKLHPGELERISRINDTFVQAAEVGRLHERMVKVRSGVSAAPKPIETPKSDITNKPVNSQPSIDQRIQDYGRQKQQRR